MKTIRYLDLRFFGLLFFFQILCVTNLAHAITPSQRAAINIWLQQQQDINPRPLDIILILKKKAHTNKINIIHYSINSKNILINAKTRIKSNIVQYKRILDTTFMFDEIKIKTTKYRNKYYYFSLNLVKVSADKRQTYNKSKHSLFKSKTQIKYLIIDLIKKLNAISALKTFCPDSSLKLKPNHVGARIKLIIYSYKVRFTGSFEQIKKALNRIENNSNYISLHNLTLVANKKSYDLEVHLRFYQQGSRRNNIDKPHVFERVNTDKVCK
jgi:hypothetical protein